ncbi:sensor histidine kinase [Promicromonospora citrea]|uniref:histidine kinase n=1 Tax=Promicromonospora citrea TaxID=43677 RepID=A0A8H9GPW8_9MICO|nr:ATP-binding protein [Promicromonospora citrea]NNH52373.1 two-component sensor histidine kinase [Promicromonospora citrea]GGM36790.1 two-component sensor histidine kinase [Promicromonospora citrea]
MPHLPDRLRPVVRAVTAEDRRGDVITAVKLVAVALGLDALGLIRINWAGIEAPAWWFLVPVAVAGVALVWRRTRPLPVVGVVAVAFAADVALGGSVGLIVLLWEALYAVHLYGRRPARRVTVGGVSVVVLAAAIVVGEITGELRYAVLGGLQAVTLLVMPMWWGANVRQGRELTAAAQERERLERERGTALLRLAEAARHDAVRAERTAVARDLHDVVASHLSAITILSGAALAGPAEAERDRAALRAVREESLASLQDMQAMIRVLRAEPAEGEPAADGATGLLAAPRVAQLASVLDQVRLGGLDLTVADPDGVLSGATVLPAAVDHAVYRVVREALTNALKHGGPRAALSVAVGDGVRVEVRDGGPHDGPSRAQAGAIGHTVGGTGLGLVSMRERVTAVGGTFTAGPQDGDGWVVRAELPLPAPAEASPAGTGAAEGRAS